MSVFKQLSSNKLQNKDIGLQKFWRVKQAMSLPQAKACTFFTMHFIRKITTYFLAYQKSSEWISWIIWHVYIHKEACN